MLQCCHQFSKSTLKEPSAHHGTQACPVDTPCRMSVRWAGHEHACMHSSIWKPPYSILTTLKLASTSTHLATQTLQTVHCTGCAEGLPVLIPGHISQMGCLCSDAAGCIGQYLASCSCPIAYSPDIILLFPEHIEHSLIDPFHHLTAEKDHRGACKPMCTWQQLTGSVRKHLTECS